MSPSASIAFPTLRDLPATPGSPGFSRSPGTTPGHVLPTGTRLRDYEICGLIGEGGFGIVYLADDHSLQRKVAIKEYMPASMVSRVAGSSAIVIKSERHLDPFKAGLKSFVNEARLLARFDHPSLVKVYRFWEENGTAYMVMPFYEGPTLKTALAELGHVPSEAELRAWLSPLLDALAVMHAARCFHRDIAPDNILLTPIGPLLLDFGAARRVIGDMTHALTVVLKPGYAPIEQYGDVASMAQGAWTDLYALACVVYYAITGRTPMSSVERLMDDRLEPIAVEAKGRYSDAFLRAIDAALAVRPSERPQDAAQFRALLDADRGGSVAPQASAPGMLQLRESIGEIPDRVVTAVPRQLVPILATEIYVRPLELTVPAPDAAPVEARRDDVAALPASEPDADSGSHEATQLMPRPTPAETEARDPAPRLTAFAPTLLQPRAAPVPMAAPTFMPSAPAPSVDPRSSFPAESVAADTPPASTSAPAPQAVGAVAAQRRGLATTVVVTLLVVAIGAVAVWAWQGRDAEPAARATMAVPPPGIATRPTSPDSATASTAATTPAAPRSATAATTATPAAADLASAPVSMPVPLPAASAPIAGPIATPTPRPTAATPATASRPRHEPTPTRAQTEPDTVREASPAPHRPGAGARCSDILQKASLEPLTAEEAAYLKRECR